MATASSALSLSSLLPFATARRSRSTRRNPNRNPNPLPKSAHRLRPHHSQPSSRTSGGGATTYTRLPPKDDFHFLSSSSSVIRLDESPVSLQESDEGEEEVFEFGSDDDEVFLSSEMEVDHRHGEDLVEDVEWEGKGNEDVKEKGVPAVMRCFDTAKVYVKAGDGGNGVVAFRREKFVPYGGPSGGDGGRGGDVYVEVDGAMNSLLPFRKAVHFRAGSGRHGQGRKQVGAKGEDVVVMVPPGTVIREALGGGLADGEVLLEMMCPGERALLLPGGRGGRGNASFKSGTNKIPKLAENGEKGAEMYGLSVPFV